LYQKNYLRGSYFSILPWENDNWDPSIDSKISRGGNGWGSDLSCEFMDSKISSGGKGWGSDLSCEFIDSKISRGGKGCGSDLSCEPSVSSFFKIADMIM